MWSRVFYKLGVRASRGTQPKVCPACNKNTTNFENAIASVLRDLGFEIIQHYRPEFLNRKELDIFLPEQKIAFEINGVLFHNSSVGFRNSPPKPYNYHADKSKKCSEVGIKLFHIWEHWGRLKAENIIKSKLNLFDNKAYARNLNVNLNPDKRKLRSFFIENHVLGYANASFSITLEKEDEIIQAIQFRKISSEIVQLSRNATLSGYQVIGGFNRLMHYAKQQLNQFKKIETFAIRDLTPFPLDSCYSRYGFTFLEDVGPSLFYWVSEPVELNGIKISAGVKSRNQFMKHKLEDKGVDFDLKSESEFLKSVGIYRVFNSGCWKYELFL